MAELTLVEAINDAFHTELGRDDSVLVMGEDVGRAGGGLVLEAVGAAAAVALLALVLLLARAGHETAER